MTITDAGSLQGNLPDAHYVEDHFHPDEYYIDVATQTPVVKEAKPSEYHIWDHVNKVWVENIGQMVSESRSQRDQLLSAIDRVNPVWYSALTAEQQQELIAYRQALLDVPQQDSFPTLIEWPTKPSWL